MWQGHDNEGCFGGSDPFGSLKRAAKRYEDIMELESSLLIKISKLEEIAGGDCTCGGVGKPKCKVCLARDYVDALGRMAGRGLANCDPNTGRHKAAETWLK